MVIQADSLTEEQVSEFKEAFSLFVSQSLSLYPACQQPYIPLVQRRMATDCFCACRIRMVMVSTAKYLVLCNLRMPLYTSAISSLVVIVALPPKAHNTRRIDARRARAEKALE